MRFKIFALILIIGVLGVVPGAAQDDETALPPITPDNVQWVRQLRILEDIPAWDAVWSPSGDQLAIGTLDGVLLCRCDTFDSPETLIDGVNAYRLAFSPDGAYLAVGTAGSPAQLILWNLAEARASFIVQLPADVRSLAYSPDGTTIAVGLAEQAGVRVYSTDGWEVARFEADIAVDALTYTPDSSTLVFPVAEDLISRQPIDGSAPATTALPCTAIDVRLTPDGTRLIASTFDCCVNVIDLENDTLMATASCGRAQSIDITRDGSLMITGNNDGTIHFVDIETGTELQYTQETEQGPVEASTVIQAHDDRITRLMVHPDGTRIVTVGLDDTVRVYGVVEPEAEPVEGEVEAEAETEAN